MRLSVVLINIGELGAKVQLIIFFIKFTSLHDTVGTKIA